MADGQCESLFWKIPLEIRYQVYDLVYVRGQRLSPQGASRLQQLDFSKGNRKGTAVRVDYGRHVDTRPTVAEKRLVSKQYLAETLQHLAENNEFNGTFWRGGLNGFSATILQHLRALTCSWWHWHNGDPLDLRGLCPNLRKLTLTTSYEMQNMSNVSEEAEWATLEELKTAYMVQAMSPVWGIQSFSLLGGGEEPLNPTKVLRLRCPLFDEDSEDDESEVFVRAQMLDDVLRAIVMRTEPPPPLPTVSKRARKCAKRKAKKRVKKA